MFVRQDNATLTPSLQHRQKACSLTCNKQYLEDISLDAAFSHISWRKYIIPEKHSVYYNFGCSALTRNAEIWFYRRRLHKLSTMTYHKPAEGFKPPKGRLKFKIYISFAKNCFQTSEVCDKFSVPTNLQQRSLGSSLSVREMQRFEPLWNYHLSSHLLKNWNFSLRSTLSCHN